MNKGKPDYVLLSSIVILIILGILALASISAVVSPRGSSYFLFRQITIGLIPGLILAFVAFKISLSFLKKRAPVLFLINLVLMALVFIPQIGASAGGANRWIALGPFSLQPSEFLKVFFILYLAAWLSQRTNQVKNYTRQDDSFLAKMPLLPFLFIIGFTSLLLIFQPDISTLGIIVLTAAIMYFLSETPFWHSILIISLGLTALAVLIKTAPYRLNRLLVFFQPGFDPMRMGYQIKQSLITIGSGGILGLGLGMGVHKLGFLPQPMSDSIFAVFAEETGFVGSLILISIFLIFAWRGFNLVKGTQDKFLQLTAAGIVSWITIQAFVNISSMVGILPLTGIPLPFISYGGSHLVAELIGVGILLNISKST